MTVITQNTSFVTVKAGLCAPALIEEVDVRQGSASMIRLS